MTVFWSFDAYTPSITEEPYGLPRLEVESGSRVDKHDRASSPSPIDSVKSCSNCQQIPRSRCEALLLAPGDSRIPRLRIEQYLLSLLPGSLLSSVRRFHDNEPQDQSNNLLCRPVPNLLLPSIPRITRRRGSASRQAQRVHLPSSSRPACRRSLDPAQRLSCPDSYPSRS